MLKEGVLLYVEGEGVLYLYPCITLWASHVLILFYVEGEGEPEAGPSLLGGEWARAPVEGVAHPVVRHLLRHVVRVTQVPLPPTSTRRSGGVYKSTELPSTNGQGIIEFFRNTRNWQCWHFCISFTCKKVRYRRNKSLMNSKHEANETDSALNHFQFTSIRSCTKMLMLSTLCITGKFENVKTLSHCKKTRPHDLNGGTCERSLSA